MGLTHRVNGQSGYEHNGIMYKTSFVYITTLQDWFCCCYCYCVFIIVVAIGSYGGGGGGGSSSNFDKT